LLTFGSQRVPALPAEFDIVVEFGAALGARLRRARKAIQVLIKRTILILAATWCSGHHHQNSGVKAA
jgi:hypothetical protein